MMGWKEGSGLGTDGEGRVDPMYVPSIAVCFDVLIVSCSQTAIYASGAGLGASKAKDITKVANDYAGYVNLVKDSVSMIQCYIATVAGLTSF